MEFVAQLVKAFNLENVSMGEFFLGNADDADAENKPSEKEQSESKPD